MNNKFTFTNKEEYLQYRKEWKAKYKELSQTIRDSKWLRNTWNRAICKAELEITRPDPNYYKKYLKYRDMLLDENPKYVELCRKRICWYDLPKFQKKATEMLNELKFAKAEAQSQYLAQKAKELTPV